MINIDNFMLFIVMMGFALCGAYFRAQYKDWRRHQTLDAKEKGRVRLLYQRDSQSPCSQAGVRVQSEDHVSGTVVGSSGCPGTRSRSLDSGLPGTRW
jgi:hypothetical protein